MGDFFDLYGFVQNNLIKSVKFLDHQRKTFKNKKKIKMLIFQIKTSSVIKRRKLYEFQY